MGFPPHLVDILAKMYYRKQKVQKAGTLSEWFQVSKGFQHRYVMLPYLFNTLAEMVM